MAKIVTPRLPEATDEYSREQISQLVHTYQKNYVKMMSVLVSFCHNA
jgi:hypothetical protein